ncbi:MAG: glycosyltransferase [Verrucomicrobiales bacterium]|nr:glycosyltransferase [Verrucomicrobiales bacterium]
MKGVNRITACGKFFRDGERPFFVKAVSFGPFPPDSQGRTLPVGEALMTDLQTVRDLGANVLRVYEVPPLSFVDACRDLGLRVIIGIPWAQHVDFLADEEVLVEARRLLVTTVETFHGHAGVLAYLVGNEIPATLVRWIGAEKVRGVLEDLIRVGRRVDPGAMFAYANYPTSEYLMVRNVDFVAFNIYLEDREVFAHYLRHLQNVAGDLPLLVTEFGVDSQHHGEEMQAEILSWHVEACCRAGVAGTTVFAFSDRWYRGGMEILDWDFGLLRRDGSRKLAFERLREQWSGITSSGQGIGRVSDLRFSVIVCTYRGVKTLAECLASLEKIDYPDYEILLINDGADEGVKQIAKEFPAVRYFEMPHGGLSAARNLGADEATGEILVYTDDDCVADEQWLLYLAEGFAEGDFAAMGGPNISPKPINLEQACVVASPGGPAHVLLDDERAEHIPGCNLAVRKEAFEAIGGFREEFWTAGDDVDFCWRLQNYGYTIGFHGAAMVWHYRRFRIKDYLRQQAGYGRAEAMLIPRHPDRFGAMGGARWQGFVYDQTFAADIGRSARIYQGPFGYAPFQSIYSSGAWGWAYVVSSFQWVLLAVVCGLVGFIFPLAAVVSVLMIATTGITALRFGWKAKLEQPFTGFRARAVVSFLALIQPLNRGMRRYLGSLPYARLPTSLPPINQPLVFPRLAWERQSTFFALWSEQALSRDDLLQALQSRWTVEGTQYSVGDGWRSWDLELLSSVWWSMRLVTVTEYHADQKCLTRLRLEGRANFMTSALRFAVLLAVGVMWRFDVLNVWLGVGLLATFAMPSMALRMQLSRVKKSIKGVAQTLGFKVVEE